MSAMLTYLGEIALSVGHSRTRRRPVAASYPHATHATGMPQQGNAAISTPRGALWHDDHTFQRYARCYLLMRHVRKRIDG